MKYGQNIVWHRWNKGILIFYIHDYSTKAEAIEKTVSIASKHGWTYPKWWQFWRWQDTTPENLWKSDPINLRLEKHGEL